MNRPPTKKMICPNCGEPAEWCENKRIYGKNYGKSYMVWLCQPCDHYVGCHQNTKKPLGTMAGPETRKYRSQAHAAFDPIWKTGKISRNKAYQWLSQFFGRRIHIGGSNIETCKKITEICKNEKPPKF